MHKVTKRADGRYVCRYEDKYFYGKTKAEVIKKYDEYVERLSQGCDIKEHVDV